MRTLEQYMTKLDQRMKRYEAFTQKFVEASPEELEELGRAILKRKVTKEPELEKET